MTPVGHVASIGDEKSTYNFSQ